MIALLGLISLFCFLGSLILLVLFLILKKPKKPILLGLGISLVVFITTVTIDSGSETSQVVKEEVDTIVESDETNEKTPEELHKDLIAEAVQADFVEINNFIENSDVNEERKAVYIEGEITGIEDDGIYTTFMISQKESEDGYGAYIVKILTICIEEEIDKKDILKVYGWVEGRDGTGLPLIKSTYLTKTQQ